MERADYLTTLQADCAVIAATPTEAHPSPVPSCPGWDVAELITHLGRVQRWAATAVTTSADGDMPAFPARPGLDGADLTAWFADGSAALLQELSADDPARFHPTFMGPRDGCWWLRRQTLEAAVHRWDAQLATGAPEPIGAALAAEGIAEWTTIRGARPWPDDLTGSIHLHATDGEGEWLLTFADGAMAAERGHHKGDTAVRGALGDLYLALWGRIPASSLDVLGDAGLLDRFAAAL